MEECLVKQASPTAGSRTEREWDGEDGQEWAAFSGEIRLLLQQLIQTLDGRNPPPPGETEDKVILDLQVGGVRCLLVRKPLETGRPDGALSPREREIARMVAKGYPNKVIARVLEISSWTVSTHLRRIFAKLGVSSRAAMVAQLLEEGKLGETPQRPMAR
jgi:DNA-binding CsgD family transcriptional regulator